MRENYRYEFYKNRYGLEIADSFKKDGYISWDQYLNNNIHGKILVKINCIKCLNTELRKSKDLLKRIFKIELCTKCSCKYISNLEIQKKKNSSSQLKIQSTAEQKYKNSLGVSRFWKEHPEKKLEMSKKISSLYQDMAFKEKWLKSLKPQTHALSGIYIFNDFQEIIFGSSYELCFLNYIENYQKKWKVYNTDLKIEYKYKNKICHYLPDFILEIDKKRVLIEIKSTQNKFYNQEKQDSKLYGTLKVLKNNNLDDYWFIDENHSLSKNIDFKRSKKIQPLCKKLYHQGKLKLFNKEKHERYIGK